MGLLRILLSICVLCGHSVPIANLNWLPPDTAVEIFFIISGFYMQLILQEKYTYDKLGKHWIKSFYIARYLRLYPIYIVAALLSILTTLIYTILAHHSISKIIGNTGVGLYSIYRWEQIIHLPEYINNILLQIFIIFTNVFIFFQDVTMFLGVYDNIASFTVNFKTSSIPLWQGLAIPQAWSLGIELLFYLLAPFLLKLQTKKLFLVAFTGLVAKGLFLFVTGLQDPWSYRFFPFEIPWFVAGSLAYRKRNKIIEFSKNLLGGLQLDIVSTYLLVTLLSVCSLVGKDLNFTKFIYPLPFALIIPLIFSSTSSKRIDRKIGELSYPFYIFHWLIISITIHFLQGTLLALLSLIITLIISYYIVKYEEAWVEPFRQKLSIPRNLK